MKAEGDDGIVRSVLHELLKDPALCRRHHRSYLVNAP
jgi:hypothetical protein